MEMNLAGAGLFRYRNTVKICIMISGSHMSARNRIASLTGYPGQPYSLLTSFCVLDVGPVSLFPIVFTRLLKQLRFDM